MLPGVEPLLEVRGVMLPGVKPLLEVRGVMLPGVEPLLELCGLMLASMPLLEMCGLVLASMSLLEMCSLMLAGTPLLEMCGLVLASETLAGETLGGHGGARRKGLFGIVAGKRGAMTRRGGGIVGLDHHRGDAIVVDPLGQIARDVESGRCGGGAGRRWRAMAAVVRRHSGCSNASKGPAVGTAPTLARRRRTHKSRRDSERCVRMKIWKGEVQWSQQAPSARTRRW